MAAIINKFQWQSVGNNDKPIIIFLDLHTKLDSVDHNILFVNQLYGIIGLALEWFKSY